MSDDRPSIAELQRLRSAMTDGLSTNQKEASANAVGTAALRIAAPMLLEIVAAALALVPELVHHLRGPSDQLIAALSKVRP